MAHLNQLIAHVLTAIVSIAAALVLMQGAAPHGPPPRIVMVDGKASVLAFLDTVGTDLPDADYTDRLTGFTDDVDAALIRVAARDNLIILDAGAVLAGAPDLTAPLIGEVLGQ